MKPFKRLPTSIRYFLTSLQALAEPNLWVPTAVFCAGGVLIWAVAIHPEWLSFEEEDIAESNITAQNAALSPEDKMIAADIDTVPVLEDQLNRSNASAGLLNNSVIATKGLYNELRGLETAKLDPAATVSLTNPPSPLPNSEIPTLPISNNNNPLNFNSAASLTPKTAAGVFATNYPYPVPENSPSDANTQHYGNPSPKPQVVSQLQTAIENYRNANSSAQKTNSATSSSPAAVTPSSSLSASQPQFSNSPATSLDLVPGLNPSIPTTLTPQPANISPNNQAQINPLNNPYQNNQPNNPYQTNLYNSGAVPEVQPVAPTATVPGSGSVSPNNFGQSSFSSPIQGSKVIDSGTPNSGNVGFPTVPQAQPNLGVTPSQVNQTFQPIAPSESTSVPRPIPGRYIGGGEINTFANP